MNPVINQIQVDNVTYDIVDKFAAKEIADINAVDVTWIEGAYVAYNGNVMSHSSYKYTDYISLYRGNLFVPIAFKTRIFRNTVVALYDKDKKILSYIAPDSDSLVEFEGEITADTGVYYIRVTSHIDYDAKIKTGHVSNLFYKVAPATADEIGNGAVETEKIVDGAVTLDKLANYKHDPRTNYIDKDKCIKDAYINANGEILSTPLLYATDKIPMQSGVSYYWYNLFTGYYAFYSADDTVIEAHGNDASLVSPINAPEGTAYARFTIHQSGFNNAWLHTKNEFPPTYAKALVDLPILLDDEGDGTLPDGAITTDKITDGAVTTEKLDNGAVTLDKLANYKHDPRTNYIDKNTLSNGYINANGVYKPYADGTLKATEKIPMQGGTTYYYAAIIRGYCAFYDADDAVIEAHGNDNSLTNPFTAPEGTAYARFTITVQNANSAWIHTKNYTGNKPPVYAKVLTGLPIYETVDNPTEYTGEDICVFSHGLCIGDSLTQGTMNYRNSGTDEYINISKYAYPQILEKLTSIPIENKGRGGATSAEWYAAEAQSDLSGYDFAIIQLGVNDSYRYGGWTDTSVAGFTNIINKLKAENKNIKIFVATIMPAISYSGDTINAMSQGIRELVASLNDENVILLDMAIYGNTKKETAYNCGHLSAYGYWRLAADYKAYIGWYMHEHPDEFREVQFIGTDYVYTT